MVWDLTPEFMWFLARTIVMALLVPITLGIGQFFSWAIEWVYRNVARFR
jgi:hypothetical protein